MPESLALDSGPAAGLPALASAYGLGRIREHRFLSDGRMNRNWRIDTEQGAFALKELRDIRPDLARRNLAVLPHLAEAGIPVVQPVPTERGETVPEIEGRAYYLTAWIEGRHLSGAEMTLAQAGHMGALIARVHLALAGPGTGLPDPGPTVPRVAETDAARAELERLAGLVAARAEPDGFDVAAAPVLAAHRDRFERHAHLRPDPSRPVGPTGWIHGDCQDWNLIWTGEAIGAVIDWDRIRVNPYATEIVRAAVYQFGLPDGPIDLGKVAALVAGYRSVAPLEPDALAEAARRHWWKHTASCWHLEFHYDRADRSCDDLFFNDARTMAWWTAHLPEAEAAFTGT